MGDDTNAKKEGEPAPLKQDTEQSKAIPAPPPVAPPLPPIIVKKTPLKSPVVRVQRSEEEIKKEQKQIEKEREAIIAEKKLYQRSEFNEKRYDSKKDNIKALDTAISDTQERIKLLQENLAIELSDPTPDNAMVEDLKESIKNEQTDLQTKIDTKAGKIAALEAFAKEYEQKIAEFDARIQAKSIVYNRLTSELTRSKSQPKDVASKPDDVKKKLQLAFARGVVDYVDMTNYSKQEQWAIAKYYFKQGRDGKENPEDDARSWKPEKLSSQLKNDITLQKIDYAKFKTIIGRPLPFEEEASPKPKAAPAKVQTTEPPSPPETVAPALKKEAQEALPASSKDVPPPPPSTTMPPPPPPPLTTTVTPTTTPVATSTAPIETSTKVITTAPTVMPLKDLYKTVDTLFNEQHQAMKRLETCQKEYDKLQVQTQSYFAYIRAPSAQDVERAKEALTAASSLYDSTLKRAQEKGEELNTRVRSQFTEYVKFTPLPMADKQKMLAELTPKALTQFIDFMEYEQLRAQQNVQKCQKTQMTLESQSGYFSGPSADAIKGAQQNLDTATLELNEAAQTLALAKKAQAQRLESKTDNKEKRTSFVRGFDPSKEKENEKPKADLARLHEGKKHKR